jgi:uncharacterized protein YjdB
LTLAVLVNSSNKTGYNTNPASPGQYQRYAERYFEHLQIPYEVFDVATVATPPADLNSRQLIVAAQPGLALPAAWQAAIQTAVQGGSGFVNLDSAPQPGNSQHLLKIFGATGFSVGTPATSITVPVALASGGSTPHYIAGMQWKSPIESSGDFVYNFHPDDNGGHGTATATLLQNATGTVIARLGNDPLITATTFGTGRAVNFGTLDYLQADRFGFMMGVDDLFWRSLVWAARKPFVVRGYPRLWALRMDHNVDTTWWTRAQEMYDPALTGTTQPDGSPWGVGGPWKVTGSVYLNFLQSGQSGRAEIIKDMQAGKLQLSPHSFQSAAFGDLFWNATAVPSPRSLTDAEEQASIKAILDWEGKLQSDQISDPLPPKGLSKWVLGHFYDLSNNLGGDLWNVVGMRYVGSTTRPGFQYTTDPSQPGYYDGRLKVHPYWIYQLPPKPANDSASDESFSFFFADDLIFGSRAGQSPQKFFLVGSRAIDRSVGGTADLNWCSGTGEGIGFAQGKFEWYTWRLYTSMAPVELYAHDDSFSVCAAAPVNGGFPAPPPNVFLPGGLKKNASQQVVQGVSDWLNAHGTHHVFMQDLAQYVYARTKSTLSKAIFDGNQITYTFTGNSTDPDGAPVSTQLLVFPGDTEGVWQTIQGFTGGLTLHMAPPPLPPTITAVTPSSGPSTGGTKITISGTRFSSPASVKIGGLAATNVQVAGPTSLTAVTPAETPGSVEISVSNVNGTGSLQPGFTYLGPPTVTRISPTSGPSSGGNVINLYGLSFTPDIKVTIGGTPATNINVSPTLITATIPAHAIGTQASVVISNSSGTATAATPYAYLDPATLLLQDSFNGDSSVTWSKSPLGLPSDWKIVNNTKDYSGINGSQQYAGNSNWQDYTFEVKVQLFTMLNWPGGIRARVSPATGAGYAVWLYPNTKEIRLYRATGWDIETPGLTTLAAAPVNLDTNSFHTLALKVQGSTIQALWDRNVILNATDSTYPAGVIALDADNQHVEFEDALVTGKASTSPTVTAVSIAPASITLTHSGATQQLTLTSTMSDGSKQDVTNQAGTTYKSSNTAVATVSNSGLVTAVAAGNATITGSNGGQSATASATVNLLVAPSLIRNSPVHGAIAGGDRMDIYATNLVPGTAVKIQGQPATVLSLAPDGSRITVTVPKGKAGPADIVVTNPNGTTDTKSGAYSYVDPKSILFQDSFNSASLNQWKPSPLGLFTNWTATQDVANYNGGGHTQIFAGSPDWTDYSVEARFIIFAGSNYPGGLRGRVNTTTGAAYEAWILPGSNSIVLYRTGGWNIDNAGLTLLKDVAVSIAPNIFNTLKLTFKGTQISVDYNGTTIIQMTDTTLAKGAIALDVSTQHVQFDDVFVTAP